MNQTRKSGVLLHPTSLPSQFGIGDFGENALHFIRFLKNANQSLWQILPLGPTSFGDSPYQSFSSFAGNHLLISPNILLEKGYLTQQDLTNAPFFSREKVDYASVSTYKNKLFQIAYQRFLKNASEKETQDYDAFCTENQSWLTDYALFVALKEYFIEERRYSGFTEEFLAFATKTKHLLAEHLQMDYYFGAVWSTWPKELRMREPKSLERWKIQLESEIGYTTFLQYEFYSQWNAVKKNANENGIEIIGDLPIFVAYDSTDVWANPQLFHLDESGFPTVVAGVPPDYFSETGQLWGNPLYNWTVHQQEDFSWWVNRVSASLKLVDFLRIDHFRGFESYWSIPFGDTDATGGSWEKAPGSAFFKVLQKNLGENLPLIAEDLGIITQAVTSFRLTTGLPGMKVLQFAFDTDNQNDYLPHNQEKNTVVYTGTHDNDTSLGWYVKSSEKAKNYFRRYMNVNGKTVPWDMIRLAMSCPANTAIFPLQDVLWLGSQDRMNTPNTVAGNWQFRFLPEMLTADMAEGLCYLSRIFGRNETLEEATAVSDLFKNP